jgi:hypothetical protein
MSDTKGGPTFFHKVQIVSRESAARFRNPYVAVIVTITCSA